MPQGCGDASLLAGTLPTPKIKDLFEANAAPKRLQLNDAAIIIKPIPLSRLRLLIFGDTSFANAGGGKSQIGRITCAADSDILLGKISDVSILTFKSHKWDKAGNSTLHVEAGNLSEALADAEWLATCFGHCKHLDYDLRKRAILNRDIQISAVTRKSDSELESLCFTDAKSLYENLSINEAACLCCQECLD